MPQNLLSVDMMPQVEGSIPHMVMSCDQNKGTLKILN
jgi:hypothetical protein